MTANWTSPIADLVLVPGVPGQPVTIDCSGSNAPTGTIRKWSVDFGDGSDLHTAKGQPGVVMHTYLEVGDYIVTLTVLDNRGNTAAERGTVTIAAVTPEPEPEPEPDPVDCVLSDWQLESSGPWSDCVDGQQSREEIWTREVLTPASGGGAPCGPLSETRTVTQACTLPEPEPEPDPNDPPPPTGGHNAYFDSLVARADRLYAYSLRGDLDQIRTGAESSRRIPVKYDAQMDAARFAIDPSGATPNSGSTDAEQKQPALKVSGTSILLTYDFRFDNGWAAVGSFITQHKTWRFDSASGSAWLTIKTNYPKGARVGALAELYITMPGKVFIAPGSWQGSSERLEPVNAQYYIQPHRWNRIWVLIEGSIGTSGAVCPVSAWVADETRDPVQLLARVPTYTPSGGFSQFRFEYDTSDEESEQGLMQSWNRNLVVLRGVSLGDVQAVLTRP